jgi:hypothetical protein
MTSLPGREKLRNLPDHLLHTVCVNLVFTAVTLHAFF